MIVDQVIYGSANRARMKGYQLLGQSEGVDSDLAKEFCRWAPSHGSLGNLPEAWGLSFFPLGDRAYAIARTMHGAPEYSGRGGLAVVTRALILTKDQLAQFQNNPVSVAQTAMALGHLLLPVTFPPTLPDLMLPDCCLPMDQPVSDFGDQCEPRLPPHAVNWVARETMSLLTHHPKIMICGVCDPLPILYLLFDALDPDHRMDTSFACGIGRSSRREYRVQFIEESLDASLGRQLAKQSITPIDLTRVADVIEQL